MTTSPEDQADGPSRAAVAPERLQPEPISWLDIHPDGSETARSGFVWSPAPQVAGRGTALWAVTDDTHTRPGESVVLVILAGRRHRVGRTVGERWSAHAGRFVDRHERYRETDPAARSYWPTTVRPTRIPGAPSEFPLSMDWKRFIERVGVEGR